MTSPVNTTVTSTSIDSISVLETETSTKDELNSLIINKESNDDNLDIELNNSTEDNKNDIKEKDKSDDTGEKNDLNEEESTIDRNLRIKRENHNALERKRRIFQKSKLEELKNCLPPLNSKKPSTITIMCKAIEYIGSLKQQIEKLHSQESNNSIESLNSEIKSLNKKISNLKKENEKLKCELEIFKRNKIEKENINENFKIMKDKNNKLIKIEESKDGEIIGSQIENNNKRNFDDNITSFNKVNNDLVTIPTAPTYKKQKLNSNATISLSNNNNNNDNKNISKLDNKSSNTDKPINNNSSSSFTKAENESYTNNVMNTLNDNNTLITSLNTISVPINDEKQNKSVDISSDIPSTHQQLTLHNTNESLDLNVRNNLNPSSNNTKHLTTPDGFIMSNVSKSSNQNINCVPLQYSNSVKTVPISTPPESTILEHQTNIPIQNQNMRIIQEPSPVQLQTTNNTQSLMVQHSQKATTLTPMTTPINSPTSMNISVNSINPHISNINVSKRGSLPIVNKVNTLNPSPVINYHHPIPQSSTQTLSTPHNSQSLYSSNVQTFRRTKSYPVQPNSNLTLQTQGAVYADNTIGNQQLQLLTTSNQVQSPINENVNYQYTQNIAVQGQQIINMSPSSSIQIQNNSITPSAGASLQNNFVQPNYISQVNNITNLSTYNSSGTSLQMIQQPLQTTIINQPAVNPQVPKNNQNYNNSNNINNNNVVYYY